jgi:hypothetical protein
LTDLVVRLLPKQREFLSCPTKWAAARGGVGSGKTMAMVWWLIRRLEEFPRATHVVVGADYEQLRRGFFPSMMGVLEESLGWSAGTDYYYRESPTPLLKFLHNGAQLRSMSAEIAMRIRSQEIQTLYLEEPQTWCNGTERGKIAWENISGRLRPSMVSSTYADLREFGRMTFNPTTMGHWIYELIERVWPQAEYGYPCWQMSLRENTLMPRLAEYIKQIQMSRPQSQWPVEIEGEWRIGGGFFFDGTDIDAAVDADLDIKPELKHDEEDRESIAIVYQDGKPWLERFPSHRYLHGWDLADKSDWTVGTTWDLESKNERGESQITMVHFERFRRKGWANVWDRIRARHSNYRNCETYVDSTGVGDVAVDELRDIGAKGVKFTATSKPEMLAHVQSLLSQRALRVPDIKCWVNEMRWYEREDKDLPFTDCVMSTAVACHGMKRKAEIYFAEV